jgi:hypothetical protein
MTRALAIALFGAATLAVIAAGFLVLQKQSPAKRRTVEAARRVEPAARVLVLAGQTAERAMVLKPRYANPAQAEFTDRALAEKIGAAPGSWRFVEVWVVNRGADDVVSLRVAPTVTARGASSTALVPLGEVDSASSSPAAAVLIRDLAPDPAVALRKGSFRRTVYALASSIRFEQLVSAEIDGIALAPRETTEDALEAFLERPRPDLIAALSKPEDSPGSRARTDRMEESR